MRLVTRADLDGLTCAVLITSCEHVSSIELVHPQDITDKRIAIGPDDILANLPYHPQCGKWFDHHLLTASNERPPELFAGAYGLAPSAARVVYDHYAPSHPELSRHEALLAETDRLDAAQLNIDDVLEPGGYILLGYTLDPRTGLGAYRDYFSTLLDALKQQPLEAILDLPEVRARISRLREQDRRFREATLEHSRLDGNVVVTDFRSLEQIPVGNRFLVYTLFPQANVSVRLHWGPGRERVAVAVGHSIFNRTCRTKVGELMSTYGGGGHQGAGTCVLALQQAEGQIAAIVDELKRRG